MRYDYVYVGITLTIAIISLLLAIIIFLSAKKSKGIWQIGFLFLLEFIYAVGYAFECISSTLPMKMIFVHVQYFSLPFIAVSWLFIAKKFQNYNFKLVFWKAVPFLIIPVSVFLTAQLSYFTDVNLYYTFESIDTNFMIGTTLFPVLILGKGVFYYLNSISNLVLTAYVFVIYAGIFFKTTGMQKKQSLSLGISSFLAMAAVVVTLFSSVSTGLDYAFFIIVFTSFVIVYAIIKYEIVDLRPQAHKATFDLASDPIVALDDKFDVVDWNKAANSFFSKTVPVRYHLPFEKLVANPELFEAVSEEKPFSFKSGDKHYIIETVPLGNDQRAGNGYLVRYNDMTSYMERLENLQYEATHDVLTQILNRRAFMDEMTSYLERAKKTNAQFSFLMIDIDDFKEINDSYGHLAGDATLLELALVINRLIPEGGIFARYGGEEFAILLKGKNESESKVLAEAIRRKVSENVFTYNELQFHINVSIGVSIQYGGDELTLNESIRVADQALYQSKRTGKNKVTTIKGKLDKTDSINSIEYSQK